MPSRGAICAVCGLRPRHTFSIGDGTPPVTFARCKVCLRDRAGNCGHRDWDGARCVRSARHGGGHAYLPEPKGDR